MIHFLYAMNYRWEKFTTISDYTTKCNMPTLYSSDIPLFLSTFYCIIGYRVAFFCSFLIPLLVHPRTFYSHPSPTLLYIKLEGFGVGTAGISFGGGSTGIDIIVWRIYYKTSGFIKLFQLFMENASCQFVCRCILTFLMSIWNQWILSVSKLKEITHFRQSHLRPET